MLSAGNSPTWSFLLCETINDMPHGRANSGEGSDTTIRSVGDGGGVGTWGLVPAGRRRENVGVGYELARRDKVQGRTIGVYTRFLQKVH